MMNRNACFEIGTSPSPSRGEPRISLDTLLYARRNREIFTTRTRERMGRMARLRYLAEPAFDGLKAEVSLPRAAFGKRQFRFWGAGSTGRQRSEL